MEKQHKKSATAIEKYDKKKKQEHQDSIRGFASKKKKKDLTINNFKLLA